MNSKLSWITGHRTASALIALSLAVVAFIAVGVVAPGTLADQQRVRVAGPAGRGAAPGLGPDGVAGLGAGPAPSAAPGRTATNASCVLTSKLVPTCGMLWGVAPSALTDERAS